MMAFQVTSYVVLDLTPNLEYTYQVLDQIFLKILICKALCQFSKRSHDISRNVVLKYTYLVRMHVLSKIHNRKNVFSEYPVIADPFHM